jgi:hypothetical protein
MPGTRALRHRAPSDLGIHAPLDDRLPTNGTVGTLIGHWCCQWWVSVVSVGGVVDSSGSPDLKTLYELGRRRLRRRRIVVWAALVAVAALVATFLVVRGHQTRTQSTLPDYVYQYGRACGTPGVAFSAAPAYGGEQTHGSVTIAFTNDHDAAKGGPNQAVAPFRYPSSTNKPEEVQLVVCVVRLPEEHFTTQHCATSDAEIVVVLPVHDARYRVTLREAHTHRILAEATLPGDDQDCPTWIRRDEPAYREPSMDTWDSFLGKYLYGPPIATGTTG